MSQAKTAIGHLHPQQDPSDFPSGRRASSVKQQSRSSTQTQTSPTQASPVIRILPNSALVHQRATSVSDQLAVASVQTGASLPLMIGNRTKCVVNLLDEDEQPSDQQPTQQQNKQQIQQSQPAGVVGPQNTANRAEQRRQNMSVSVVRPVVVVNSSPAVEPFGAKQTSNSNNNSKSLLDDWMVLDNKIHLNDHQQAIGRGLTNSSSLLEELLALQNLDSNTPTASVGLKSEQELKQQIFLFRREEHELNRSVRRQHQFMLQKLEERKRQLNIIQSVWAQRDFKHAIEKLVDIYQQGLIFTTTGASDYDKDDPLGGLKRSAGGKAQSNAKLKSLNTSLAVDVIGIIILRPRLWTLDICQLLLPIINQDLLGVNFLLMPNNNNNNPSSQQQQCEYYAEIGLKALRLILTNFSSIIKSTLESLKDSGKLVGIDLSREDRINKCLACYKLLLDSRAILSSSAMKSSGGQQIGAGSSKLAGQYRELQAMFSALFSSIQLEPNILARRLQGNNS